MQCRHTAILKHTTITVITTIYCKVDPPSAGTVFIRQKGGGPRVVVSTAAFHARVRGSVPGLGGLKETKNVSSTSTCESQYCGEPL